MKAAFRTEVLCFVGVFAAALYLVQCLVPLLSRDVVADKAASTPTVPDVSMVNAATNADQSLNWSGYVAQGGSFSSVSGSWVVPKVRTDEPIAADATWVGIGGVQNKNLIQAGTQAIVDQSGAVAYESWIERLPGDSVPVPLPITAGDSVSVSLQEARPGWWNISMRNNTTGKTYDTTVAYDSTKASAEWIQEMPAGNVFLPLDMFGAIRFTAASAVRDGATVTPKDAGARALAMITLDGRSLAMPSVLADSGDGFVIARTFAPVRIAKNWYQYAIFSLYGY